MGKHKKAIAKQNKQKKEIQQYKNMENKLNNFFEEHKDYKDIDRLPKPVFNEKLGCFMLN